MVKVKKETVRSDTSKKAVPSKNKLKLERQKQYTKYLRSKQFKEVKDIVYARQGGICPICGDLIDADHPGSCHHRDYKYAGMGGEIEAAHCVYIHCVYVYTTLSLSYPFFKYSPNKQIF